jgi:hypothetical protein
MRDGHAIADLVLHGYASDVVQQCRATFCLADSKWPRTSYATARSAFEAAIDMLLLVSEPSEFDRTGALAYAIERVETEQLRQRFLAADIEGGFDDDTFDSITPEEAAETDAVYCDRKKPGTGDLVRHALVEAREPGRAKKHWSGLGMRGRSERIQARMPNVGGIAMAGDAFYGYMSVQAHPRLRAGADQRSLTDDGTLRIKLRSVALE